MSVVTSFAASALYGQRLFCVFFFFFVFVCVCVSSVLFPHFVLLGLHFSFVEICPIVFHLSQIPRFFSIQSVPALKKLTRRKKEIEKKSKKRKKKKVHDFSLPFHGTVKLASTSIRMQRARALTLSTPRSFKLNTAELLLWPTRETDGISYVARQPLSFSKTREKRRNKKSIRASTISQPRPLSHTTCGGRGNTRTHNFVCQVLSSYSI